MTSSLLAPQFLWWWKRDDNSNNTPPQQYIFYFHFSKEKNHQKATCKTAISWNLGEINLLYQHSQSYVRAHNLKMMLRLVCLHCNTYIISLIQSEWRIERNLAWWPRITEPIWRKQTDNPFIIFTNNSALVLPLDFCVFVLLQFYKC